MKKGNILYYKIMLLVFGTNAIIYMALNHLVPTHYLLELPIDGKIPFIPAFIWLYSIWYPMVILSLFIVFKYDKKDFVKTMISIVIGLVISYFFFIVFPSTVNRPLVESYNSLTSFLLYITYKLDNPVNCFPSDHALMCLLLLYSIIKNKNIPLWFRIFSFFSNILIILSTLFIKQHVVADLIGSLVISLTIYYIVIELNVTKKLVDRIIKSL